MKKHIVIVGAGTAGITTAALLARKFSQFEITLIDPAQLHFYQPLWTLVGGGIFPKEKSQKPMKEVIPAGVHWEQESVTKFSPEQNTVHLANKKSLEYDYLIVCPGIQIDWDKVEGLRESLGKNGVCSNYDYQYVSSTFEFISNLKKGNALFTYPNTPIKCGGAPQKIMYLAEEYFQKAKVRDSVQVEFVTAGERVFGVQKYREALEKVIKERNIRTSFKLNLVKVDGPNQLAFFKNIETNEIIEREFSLLHAVPPMSAPEFIKTSPLANSDGWVDVDKFTLQHNKFNNIFSLGDASSLPTSKTGAAIRKQVHILVHNLFEVINQREPNQHYNGYTSCPLVTGYHKAIMAEFDYDGNPDETFPFDQSKERLSMFLAKKYGIPFMYWNAMLKGYTG